MRIWLTIELLMMCTCLAGCYSDPFQNPGNWSLTGASRENTAIEAAVPSQLIVGQPDDSSNGVAASGAIDKALGGSAGTAAGLETPPATSSLSITGG